MSLVINCSRVPLVGLASRSPANRFLPHLRSYSNAQLRNVVVCSGGFHSTENRRQQRKILELPVIRQHQYQTLRYFFRDESQRAQPKPAEAEPEKKPSEQDEASKAPSPVEGSGSMQQAEPAKLGLFARFKKMYKEYWYVLVPVHCVTSVFWFGGFYYASKSGVDVIALLESMGVSQKLIDPVRDSSLGHIAVAYLLYKIATPARYTVTLGGTTLSIKYLVSWGYIKPIPSKAKLVQMYKDKKEGLQERYAEKKQDFQERKQQLADASKKNIADTMKTLKSKKGVTEQK